MIDWCLSNVESVVFQTYSWSELANDQLTSSAWYLLVRTFFREWFSSWTISQSCNNFLQLNPQRKIILVNDL